jgi:uncharacterized OsmC-like protein
MTPETIRETMSLWAQEPGKAKSKPTVTARSDGSQAAVEAGPFSWRIDLPPALGGQNQAPSPTASLLGALAGCAVVFIRDTLGPQLGIQIDAVEATVQAETDARGLLGMDGVAPDLQNLALEIRIHSPAGESEVQKVYQVWRERCPIYLALIKSVDISLAVESAGQ